MIISDLNHLETVEVSVVGGFNLGNDYSNIQFNEYLTIFKKIQATAYVKGSTATVESDAKALGHGTLTQVFTNTMTAPGMSSSNGVSISASSGYYYY